MAVASDLEGTLTMGKTWKALGRYLIVAGKRSEYRAFALQNLPAALAVKAQLMNQQAFEERWMHKLLPLLIDAKLDLVHVAKWVVDHELWPKRKIDILTALKAHQAAGERLILTAGTFQPVLESFAEKLRAEGLNIEVIGTSLEQKNGRLTGLLKQPINIGATKAKRLHDTLGPERLYCAYANTDADIPMLMLSDRPVAVSPNKPLRKTAKALGWTILEN